VNGIDLLEVDSQIDSFEVVLVCRHMRFKQEIASIMLLWLEKDLNWDHALIWLELILMLLLLRYRCSIVILNSKMLN